MPSLRQGGPQGRPRTHTTAVPCPQGRPAAHRRAVGLRRSGVGLLRGMGRGRRGRGPARPAANGSSPATSAGNSDGRQLEDAVQQLRAHAGAAPEQQQQQAASVAHANGIAGPARTHRGGSTGQQPAAPALEVRFLLTAQLSHLEMVCILLLNKGSCQPCCLLSLHTEPACTTPRHRLDCMGSGVAKSMCAVQADAPSLLALLKDQLLADQLPLLEAQAPGEAGTGQKADGTFNLQSLYSQAGPLFGSGSELASFRLDIFFLLNCAMRIIICNSCEGCSRMRVRECVPDWTADQGLADS